MGLDNIPKNYPCKNIATRDEEGRIDCQKTQDAGNCPWKNEYESDPMLKESGPTYGMFGTNCWYRGKWGNSLMEYLSEAVDHDFSFYGEGMEDGEEGMSAEYCLKMSLFMKDHIEQFAYVMHKECEPDVAKRNIADYIYASWWLEFVGKHCNGSGIWY